MSLSTHVLDAMSGKPAAGVDRHPDRRGRRAADHGGHQRRRPDRAIWATTCRPACTACTSTRGATSPRWTSPRSIPRSSSRSKSPMQQANTTSRYCSRRMPIPPTEGVERCPRSSSARTSTARQRTASSESIATPPATRFTTSTYPPVCEAISAPPTWRATSPRCCPPTPRSRPPTPTPRRTAWCRSKTTAWRWRGTSSTTSSRSTAPASRSRSTPGSGRWSTAPSTTTPGSARARRSAPPRSPWMEPANGSSAGSRTWSS